MKKQLPSMLPEERNALEAVVWLVFAHGRSTDAATSAANVAASADALTQQFFDRFECPEEVVEP